MLRKYKLREYYSLNELIDAAISARKKWSGKLWIVLGSSNQDCEDSWRGGVKAL